MRIIAGAARGRQLHTRAGGATRPTDARAREALFNILGERTVDATWLDLYAGSGAVGLEALSRGAAHCTFIEKEAPAARILRTNVQELGFADQAEVWNTATRPALGHLAETGRRFHIIFADPPFSLPRELQHLGERLDSLPQLLDNGSGCGRSLLIVQHHRKAALTLGSAFRLWRERQAGESLLSFWELAVPESGD